MNGTPPEWWPDWRDQIIVIVASGPSAIDSGITAARGKARVIVVNDSWKLAPWADLLFAADFPWWRDHDGCRAFAGLRVTTDERAYRSNWGVHKVEFFRSDSFLMNRYNCVGWGGSSGFQAFNLAAQFSPSRIALVGFDARIDRGLHWHGPHNGGLPNPNAGKIMRWRRCMDAAARTLARLNIDVVNCSPHSALVAYRKVPLSEVLSC